MRPVWNPPNRLFIVNTLFTTTNFSTGTYSQYVSVRVSGMCDGIIESTSKSFTCTIEWACAKSWMSIRSAAKDEDNTEEEKACWDFVALQIVYILTLCVPVSVSVHIYIWCKPKLTIDLAIDKTAARVKLAGVHTFEILAKGSSFGKSFHMLHPFLIIKYIHIFIKYFPLITPRNNLRKMGATKSRTYPRWN